jgi:peptidoglycan/xylan/chitin deacetylase (PgdA/CDA1 family)/glycosyltransferase involved in cell wall biosynthesis
VAELSRSVAQLLQPGDGLAVTAKLACVVMSLHDEPGLIASVQSLLDQPEDVEIVVVNTGGGDPAASLVAAGIDVPVINHQERLYPGAVRNIGIENTTAPYVAFLEADCLALPGWAAARLREHKAGACAVGSSMTNAYPDSVCAWAGLLLLDHRRMHVTPEHRRLNYGLSLDRGLFERYGAFREDLRAAEDTEFRERLAGDVRIAWASDVVSAHRYPTKMRELIRDTFRRGRLQAAMIGMIRGDSPRSLRIAFWGSVGSVHALRVVLRTRGAERRRLLRAWPLVLPASVAFSAGALTARLRPYDGERAPTAIRQVSGCTRRLLALTFDDGPSNSTRELLDVLRRHRARATFFVTGQAVPGHEPLLRHMTTAGHEIGSHLASHTAPDLLSERQLRTELEQTATRIESAVSIPPRLVRPPYGSGAERLARVARQVGLGKVVLWSVDPRDWTEPKPRTTARRILDRARPGDIVLLHDRASSKGGERSRTTIASLEELIPALRERGYEFVTVSELLDATQPRREVNRGTTCKPTAWTQHNLRHSKPDRSGWS